MPKRAPQRNQNSKNISYHREKISHNLQVLHVYQDLIKNPNQHCPQNPPLLAKSGKIKLKRAHFKTFTIDSRLRTRVAVACPANSLECQTMTSLLRCFGGGGGSGRHLKRGLNASGENNWLASFQMSKF